MVSRPVAAPSIAGADFDFVTVVHGGDLGLLRIQARSLATYLSASFTGDIIVIVNDLALRATIRRFNRMVLPDYGHLQAKVRVIPFTTLGAGLDPANGWIFQQALKLAVARHLSRPHYVVLDAKNHAIKPLGRAHFVTEDERAIQQLSSCKPSMPEHQEACARYFGLDPAHSPECATMTPFVMCTDLVRQLLTRIERDEKCSIFAFFRRTRLLSEFKLYRLFLHAAFGDDVERYYVSGPIRAMTIWERTCDLKQVVATAETCDHVSFLGVHGTALAALEQSDGRTLEDFWRRHGFLRPEETLGLVRADA